MNLRLQVNHQTIEVESQPGDSLLKVLRANGYFGVKHGCETGECGACAILLDGKPVNSCLFPAAEVEGRTVTTVEGLQGPHGKLSAVQKAFVDHGAIQCGFCTPGMIMSATALLSDHPDPTEVQIREALAGNICRCTGYVQIVVAVRAAAGAMRRPKISATENTECTEGRKQQ